MSDCRSFLLRLAAIASLSASTMLFTGCAGGAASSSTGGGGGSTTATLTIAGVSPTNVPVGSNDITLVVTGTGFTSSSVISLGSTAEPTTYVSDTQLKAAVAAAQLKLGTVLSVSVNNGSTTVKADTQSVALSVDNPVPSLISVSPAAVLLGTSASSITVTGTNFVPGVALAVNGSTRDTTFVSDTQLTAALTAADFATAQALPLNVINPKPGGGMSGTSSLAVNNPAPSITSLAPSSVVVGAAAAKITINGSGFLPSTVLQINGITRAATYVSGTQMTVGLTTADFASTGTLTFVLYNMQPGGGPGVPANFIVAPKPAATPVLSTVSPTSFVAGSGDTSISAQGTNLTASTKLLWNGTTLDSTVYNTVVVGNTTINYLSAKVAASLIATKGTASITASTPGASANSNALTVSITDPPAPTITSISPSAAPIGKDATLSIYGTGFTASTTLQYSGVTYNVSSVTSTSLSVTIPASALSRPGLANVTVTTPAPGGGSASKPFLAYVAVPNNSMVYNPVKGLFYASIPSSAGAPLGNAIVSIDPLTGALGTPIPVGSEPNKLAVTSDGRYLWVGLDGSSAVRKVDLNSGTAGLQFSLTPTNSGIYNAPQTVLALAALPGATDSVVISSSVGISSSPYLSIYDAGVQRTATSTTTSYNQTYALQIDGTKNEIYAGGSTFNTYTYSSTGITTKATNNNANVAGSSTDEMQLLNGRIYTDTGRVLDAESGATLGTYYSSGQTVAAGSQVTEPDASKTFVLETNNSTSGYQIQAFNPSDFTAGAFIAIPSVSSSSIYGASGPRLTRWGANGLAFRTTDGFFSLQTAVVKDLSASQADLGVSITSSGSTTTGATGNFTVKVANGGPSDATDVFLFIAGPSNGVVTAVTTSGGTCYLGQTSTCALGTLTNGSSATVSVSVLQTTAGDETLSATVSGSTTDSTSSNNSASTTVAITGNAYALPPVLASFSPSALAAGSTDTVITVLGANFNSTSIVSLASSSLATTFVNSGKLTAMVPAANLTKLGWAPVTVTTPGLGGGTSSAQPLSVYQTFTLGANHILTDPYSGQIMVSVGAGSSTIKGNTIVALTPSTGLFDQEVAIGSQPTSMALSSTGQTLYTVLNGNQSIARFNMLSRSLDYTYAVGTSSTSSTTTYPRGLAVQTGSENTLALDLSSWEGNILYDFDPVNKTATKRGSATGPYTGSCIAFLDANNMLSFDIDTSGFSLDHYTVTPAGFQYYNYSQYTSSTLNHFGCFKLSGGLAFANAGGIADPSGSIARQIATLPTSTSGGYSSNQGFVPDSSLRRAFYLTSGQSYGVSNAITSYDLNTYLASSVLPIDFASIEGSSSYSIVDVIRWGQDGLAMLTSTGHIYLIRGAFVVPQELGANSAATLTSSSATTITAGTGNTLLTLTGSNFIPGVAVTWNGSYRTTTIVDATHVTVAIPASDLAAAGTGQLVATNPGASASSAITVTVQ